MSDRYESARADLLLREGTPGPDISELEIQARLLAGEFGTRFPTPEGEYITVERFGEWNRESGPDFRNAAVRWDDGRILEGDIEVDREARDWEAHGHAVNPAFAGVILQLYASDGAARAFARTSDHRVVTQARFDLRGAVPRHFRPSRGGALGVDRVEHLAGVAAGVRIRRKCQARACAIRWHGRTASLLQAVAAGLGYKDNTVPMLLVAQRAGIGRGEVREAVLFGLAGFLEPRTFDDADGVTRSYLKPLWDEWWSLRDAMARIVLPKTAWKLSGIRPANHPHRRIGALAAVAAEQNAFAKIRTLSAFEEVLEGLGHCYWNHHWNLRAARLARPMALIGKDRIRDLAVNAFLPALTHAEALEALAGMPAPTPSAKILRACDWLCGGPHPKLLRSALVQQGLLQLAADFGHLPADEVAERLAEA